MNILFALPGLHRYDRGAEIAFISVANELTKAGDNVTLIGSGGQRESARYRFVSGSSVPRETFERFPSLPLFRSPYVYEELTFAPSLLRNYRPKDFDVTVTCAYPFTNWILRGRTWRGRRPPHVFVTQNGDWPAQARNSEYRYFGCEGLVCINPDYYERNQARWNCRLIPNGVDLDRFFPGRPERGEFGLPEDRLVVLMVSALIPNKRVDTAIDAVSRISDAHLVVAGDGPMRQSVDERAHDRMPGRFLRVRVAPERMPALYRSADVFLHLSQDESFGNVYLEAMSTGLPVVAHDSARSRWILGDDEFLVDTNDLAAVVNRIGHAAQAQRQPEQRLRKVARFSWSGIAASYRDFFRETIVKHARSVAA